MSAFHCLIKLCASQGAEILAVLHGHVSATCAALIGMLFTPAGVPVVRFRIRHESTQLEAGTPRKIGCEISGLAFSLAPHEGYYLPINGNIPADIKHILESSEHKISHDIKFDVIALRRAGVELGGTKCICILASDVHDVCEQVEVPTTTPADTLAAIGSVPML